MTTTKVQHEFFPTGKGLAIMVNSCSDDLVLFYALEDQFTVWATGIDAPNTPDELKSILDTAMRSDGTQGTSQIGSLSFIFEDMPDNVLGEIYEAVVGYNPFDEQTPDKARELVTEYMCMPETLSEVFGKVNKYGHVYGCQSPAQTAAIFQALDKAGFNPIDTTWHNDASDSIEVELNGVTYRVWVGDPASEDDDFYSKNHLCIVNRDTEDDDINGVETIEEIIYFLQTVKK